MIASEREAFLSSPNEMDREKREQQEMEDQGPRVEAGATSLRQRLASILKIHNPRWFCFCF
jgi:hypothetical protein